MLLFFLTHFRQLFITILKYFNIKCLICNLLFLIVCTMHVCCSVTVIYIWPKILEKHTDELRKVKESYEKQSKAVSVGSTFVSLLRV